MIAIGLDIRFGFVGKSIGKIVSRLIGESRKFKWSVIACLGPTFVPARNLYVKSLIEWAEGIFTEMPLSNVSSPIAVALQGFCDCDFIER